MTSLLPFGSMITVAMVAGSAAGPAVAAVTAAVPDHGRVVLPAGWWHGAGAAPRRLLLISAASGAAAGTLVARLPHSGVMALAWWVLAVCGTGLAVTDLEYHRLPTVLLGPLAGVSLACLSAASTEPDHELLLVRAAVAGAVVWVVFGVLTLLAPHHHGAGDTKLKAALALLLAGRGIDRVLLGLLCGELLAAAASLLLFVTRRVHLRTAIPTGPAALAGAVIVLLR